jgi:hypothetical protein
MFKRLILLACAIVGTFVFSGVSRAQTSRKSVSVAEVTGTFHQPFGGKFKGSANEIRIMSIGRGKLRVAFDLTYPYTMANGELMANTGQIDGEAAIEADTALFTGGENGECRIRIRFVKLGLISVDQQGDSTGCGFGLNVSATGTYRKVSGAKPKFEQ